MTKPRWSSPTSQALDLRPRASLEVQISLFFPQSHLASGPVSY